MWRSQEEMQVALTHSCVCSNHTATANWSVDIDLKQSSGSA